MSLLTTLNVFFHFQTVVSAVKSSAVVALPTSFQVEDSVTKESLESATSAQRC